MNVWLQKRRLRKFKDRGVDALLQEFATAEPKRRGDIMNVFWGLAGKWTPEEKTRAAVAIEGAADDPEPTVRGQAIAALLAYEAPNAVDRALAALSDPDWYVRTIVTSQLGAPRSERIVSALIPLLADTDGFVREQVAYALMNQGDPRAIPALEEMVRRENRDVEAKKAAKQALAVLRQA